MMIERSFLLFVCSIVLNIVLTVCLLYNCINPRAKVQRHEECGEEIEIVTEIPTGIPADTSIKNKTLEDVMLELYAEQVETAKKNTPATAGTASSSPRVSYTRSGSSSVRGLASIRGRVNTGEINPINFDNPDINVLRQMGADPYLIHYFTGEQFFKAGNFDRAITEYTQAINNYSNFTEAYISRANAYLKRKDFVRAIDDYSRAIRLDSSKAEIYNYRGFARSERGEHSLAIEDFTRALSINPRYVDALINRSHSYNQLGNYDKVIEDCSRIINLEPNNASIWNRRGSAYYSKEDDDKAISDFTEAIRLRRNYTVAYQNRGNAWQSKGDLEKAQEDFVKARSLAN